MAATSRTTKTKSAQQWAWEFLRRNPDYRDAFQKLFALSPQQLAQLTIIAIADEDNPPDEEIVFALDIQFFDTSLMLGYKDQQRTVGEYFDQSKRLRELMNEPKVRLSIALKFRLTTYSLATWYNPEDEFPASDIATMWRHCTPISLGLTPAPWAKGLSFEGDNEIDEHVGWPVRTPDENLKNKVDKRRRKSPRKSGTALPLIQGIDDSIYLTITDDCLPLDHAQARVVIDLNLPIDFQLMQAKHLLEEHQKALVQGGFVPKLPKQADRFGAFEEYLKILDLLESGDSHLDIAAELDGLVTRTVSWKRDPESNQSHPVKRMTSRSKPNDSVNELTQAVRKKIERALHLRDRSYRALALSA